MITLVIDDQTVADRYSLRSLGALDLFARVRPLIDGGAWFLTPEGKIAKRLPGADHATPWVSVRHCPVRRCERHHTVLFRQFGVIPRFCFDCYKVVVRPRTVLELFKLHDLLATLPAEMPSKCGLDLREYTPGAYTGFVYCLGLEEGRARHRLVREAVAEGVGSGVPVSLKRGCTEFELRHGDSSAWAYDPAWRECEEWVDEHVLFPEPVRVLPAFLKASIMHGWLRYAHRTGDPTSLAFNGGAPFLPAGTTYAREGEQA